MGKMGLTKEAALQNISRNPQQMLEKMQMAIDPRILRQIGGAGNMMNLFREVRDDKADTQTDSDTGIDTQTQTDSDRDRHRQRPRQRQ